MVKIVIYNRKGGVGKTVSCVNIAGCLAKTKGYKVLVIDTDAQANATSYLMLHDENTVRYGLNDLFHDPQIDPNKIIHKAKILDKKNESFVDSNIYIVPASKELDELVTDDQFVIKRFLDSVEDKFDYCLIDCSPSVTEMTINALCAADYVMIPSLAGRDSVTGYGMVMDEIDAMKENGFNVPLKILGVFLNAVDKRRAIEDYYRSFWVGDKKRDVFVHSIRNSSEIVNAQEFCKPIHYYKNCPVAKDYEELVQEMEAKIGSFEGMRKKGKRSKMLWR